MTSRHLIAFSFLLVSLAVAGANAADTFTVQDHDGQHADIITPEGKVILRYMYARDKTDDSTTFDTAKVFAHVMTDDGVATLTKGAGGKFPHHRGIFIGWNKLNQGGKNHDLWHVRNTVQKHREFDEIESGKNGARITSHIDWVGVDGEVVLEETRTYKVTSHDGIHAMIDFSSTLKATRGDVELNGDPEHAGVQFRPSQQVAENQSATYLFHQDGIDPKVDRDMPWVTESFQLGDQWWSVQHMNHPSNPKGARWSAYRDYGRFGPFTVVKINNNEATTFRYRFCVTKGKQEDREASQSQFDHYAN
ncbi:PmoA family protein [bacterium]|nr:PmoA family protein [bacterium]